MAPNDTINLGYNICVPTRSNKSSVHPYNLRKSCKKTNIGNNASSQLGLTNVSHVWDMISFKQSEKKLKHRVVLSIPSHIPSPWHESYDRSSCHAFFLFFFFCPFFFPLFQMIDVWNLDHVCEQRDGYAMPIYCIQLQWKLTHITADQRAG